MFLLALVAVRPAPSTLLVDKSYSLNLIPWIVCQIDRPYRSVSAFSGTRVMLAQRSIGRGRGVRDGHGLITGIRKC